MAVSPDGRRFVYNATGGLYLRTMGELEARLIPGTEEGLCCPFFSPDGESVGYWQAGELKRIAISGGAPTVVAAATNNLNGATWGPDGTILFGQPEGIIRVSASGGVPELVVPAEDGEVMDGPQLLPDGESVLFSVTRGTSLTSRWDEADIVVQSLATGERTVVWQGGSDARYLPTGHLIYALEDGLFAVAFDIARLEAQGGPVSVVDGLKRAVISSPNSATANYGVSNQGTLVYVDAAARFSGGPLTSAMRTLVWVDRQGREESLAAPPRPYSYPRLSPDGTQVAVDSRDADSEIWVWNIARETLTRLTFNPGFDRFPLWSPDGRRIAFSSQQGGSGSNLYWRPADGTGQAELLADGGYSPVYPTSFAPDGTGVLVYGDPLRNQEDNIGIVSLGGGADRAVVPLLNATFNERNAEVSPDGRWLAYESDESGRSEVYVRPFPNVDDGRWPVSTGGGSQPLWARNGQELFYRSGDALMVVPIQRGSTFVAGTPALVFEEPYLVGLGGRAYDISPDGRRFLMLKEGAGEDPQSGAADRLIIVQNFFEELQQRVPVN